MPSTRKTLTEMTVNTMKVDELVNETSRLPISIGTQRLISNCVRGL